MTKPPGRDTILFLSCLQAVRQQAAALTCGQWERTFISANPTETWRLNRDAVTKDGVR